MFHRVPIILVHTISPNNLIMDLFQFIQSLKLPFICPSRKVTKAKRSTGHNLSNKQACVLMFYAGCFNQLKTYNSTVPHKSVMKLLITSLKRTYKSAFKLKANIIDNHLNLNLSVPKLTGS